MSDEWIVRLYQLVEPRIYIQPTHPLEDIRMGVEEPTHNALDQA